MKRMKFKSEATATEKQIKFINDLMASKKKDADTYKWGAPEDTELVRKFWELAVVPSDLGAWEAPNLIDTLKSNTCQVLLELTAVAIDDRDANDLKNNGVWKKSLSLLALTESVKLIEEIPVTK